VPDRDLPTCRALLADGIRAGHHLGGQLYVSLGGAAVADWAVGESRPGTPMTPETLVLWLSSGKPLTAVAVAQLWERGLLGLDDPVARHLPEFAAGGKERVTLRHCLTHTGGFRLLEVGWPQEPWEAILARICRARLEPRWVPGEKAGYHLAASWFVLAEVVRRLDGRPIERYLREAVLEPLAMADSWLGMPPERWRSYGERIAGLWDTEASPPQPLPWHDEPHLTRPNPGSSACGPIRELGRFYETLLAGGGPILRPQTVEALTARHRTGLLDQTFRHVMDWGLGFIPNPAIYGDATVPYAYGRHASRRAVGHSGRRSSTAFADPEHALVVALAVNGMPSDEVHRQRFQALAEAVYEDLGLVALLDRRP
jgi:CubicO group peptidase (beta-lactamase class C family)